MHNSQLSKENQHVIDKNIVTKIPIIDALFTQKINLEELPPTATTFQHPYHSDKHHHK
jgi:hypothetical protein